MPADKIGDIVGERGRTGRDGACRVHVRSGSSMEKSNIAHAVEAVLQRREG